MHNGGRGNGGSYYQKVHLQSGDSSPSRYNDWKFSSLGSVTVVRLSLDARTVASATEIHHWKAPSLRRKCAYMLHGTVSQSLPFSRSSCKLGLRSRTVLEEAGDAFV